jgi:hypothetical protein
MNLHAYAPNPFQWVDPLGLQEASNYNKIQNEIDAIRDGGTGVHPGGAKFQVGKVEVKASVGERSGPEVGTVTTSGKPVSVTPAGASANIACIDPEQGVKRNAAESVDWVTHEGLAGQDARGAEILGSRSGQILRDIGQ